MEPNVEIYTWSTCPFCILSTGVVFPNLKPYPQAKQKLARLQRYSRGKLKAPTIVTRQ
jgi:glutaredoxin